MTLSLLALQLSTDLADQREAASIVSIFIILLTVGMAIPLRAISLRLGVRHDVRGADSVHDEVTAARQLRPAPAA
jgi:hypothetical protein